MERVTETMWRDNAGRGLLRRYHDTQGVVKFTVIPATVEMPELIELGAAITQAIEFESTAELLRESMRDPLDDAPVAARRFDDLPT